MSTPPAPVEPVSAVEITTTSDPWSLAEVAEFFADLDSIYLYAHDQAQLAGTAGRLKAFGDDVREGDAAIDRPEVVFLSLASPMVVELATWAQQHLDPSLGWMFAFLRSSTGRGGLFGALPNYHEGRARSAEAKLRKLKADRAIEAIERVKHRVDDVQIGKRRRKRKGH
ncbi:hypothetical protein [Streptomyces sp. NBC_00986]|uniref:hypothetical protein n=1 Tax=Streptomyces sp. NBC_00986 TaxID=2903702 RepID=UPI00386731F0|nr:hypothetical protein OG504_20230 [Streptomyces sp. NBC_00986]